MLTKLQFSNRDEMCKAILYSLSALIRDKCDNSEQFHLALTGGRVGGEIARDLALLINASPVDFAGLHIWWSDERFVSYDDPERNSRHFIESLGEETPVHIHEISVSNANISIDTAARRYAADIHGIDMDVTLLSVGGDGHVASLFPADWRSEETVSVIAVHNAPKAPSERVSFTMRKINESSQVWLLASGPDKREVVERLMASDPSIPATYARGRNDTKLFTDCN